MASSTAMASGGAGEREERQGNSQVGSSAVELNRLSAHQHVQSSAQDQTATTSPSTGEKSASQPQSDNQIQSSATQTSFPEETPALVARKEAEAIGPATDAPPSMQHDPAAGPAVMITLLLPTGARHPFKIDEKYLKKRNVSVEDMNPVNISVYTMKELIWRDWREEWEPRPTSPNYIRLIFFGSMLDDKSALKDCKFNADAPNVVHMTVKPQEIVDDEDVKQTKHGRRGSDGDRGGFRCCVVL